MKEIKAIIRPNKLSGLRDALIALPGFPGMTVSKVEGCSAPSRHISRHNIKDELTDYTPKVRIEIVSPDEVCDSIVDLIVHTAQIGQIGDGLVWVTDITRAVFLYKSVAGPIERP
jgi:nitrogen regulatory protein P-II 1